MMPNGSLGLPEELAPAEAVKLMLETAQHAQWASWDEALKRLRRKYNVVLTRLPTWPTTATP